MIDDDGEPQARPLSDCQPASHDAVLIRTDFSDDTAWTGLIESISRPSEEGFTAYVRPISDPVYRDLNAERLMAVLSADFGPSFFLVADAVTITHLERPVLVIDLLQEAGCQFRAIPSAVPALENNLSISNMDFSELARCADGQGVIRGF